MALNKTYNRINWQNRPSTSTALGATNLNKMDYALNEVDNRLILLDDGKADKTTVNTLVREVTLNPATGVLTVTLLNGTVTSYDLDIEKVVTNFNMNAKNQLVLTLAGGIEKVIDLSKFIDIYTFSSTQTVSMTNIDNTINASVKLGSVTEGHLDTGLMQEIRQKALDAGDSAADSLLYSRDSKRYAIGGEIEGDAEDNAKYYRDKAAESNAGAQEALEKLKEFITGTGFIPILDKGKPGGVATLDNNGKVPSGQLQQAVRTYTATIGTTWAGATAPFTQEITINGIKGTDTPVVDVVLSNDTTTAVLQEKAWVCVSRVTTSDNKIKVYCNKDRPITAIPIQLKVVG